MMLKLLYLVILFLFIFSILVFILSNKNKDKRIAKAICWVSIVYLIHILSFTFYTPIKLNLDIKFNFIYNYAFAIIASIFYFKSFLKSHNIDSKEDDSKFKKGIVIFIVIVLIVLPPLILMNQCFREMYYINNTKVTFVYYDYGNGSIGSSRKMVFSIGDKYCKEIEIGANKNLNNFIYKEYQTITPIIYNFSTENLYNNNDILQEIDNYIIVNDSYNNNEIDIIDEKLAKSFIDLYENSNEEVRGSFNLIYIKECNYYIIDSFHNFIICEGDKYLGEIEKFHPGNFEIQDIYYIK